MRGHAPAEADVQAMRRQLEDGTYLGSCDWGCCNRQQVGWGWSEQDPSPEWLPICRPCSDASFSPRSQERFSVDGLVLFEDLVPAARVG